MAPGVQRIPIRQGKLRATLFLPEGDGPFPGVIDLFGTAGGLIEFRGAQLASRGIAALSLAYLDFEDIPAHLDVLDISYFEEAVQFLMANEKVKKTDVGAIGISKGADLACSMGALIPEVKAVVCINGIPVNTWCPLKTRDKTYPGLHFDISRGKIINQDLVSTIDMMDDSESFPETHVPLHESDASFLFIVGLEDRNWKTELETTRAVEKMKAHGKTSYEVSFRQILKGRD
ncbi:UNVERIFIED_CONTAM: hypothetical protein GTU68_032604 [Idotea baltica]|nr:hypothetical protein [Idotea baltica]